MRGIHAPDYVFVCASAAGLVDEQSQQVICQVSVATNRAANHRVRGRRIRLPASQPYLSPTASDAAFLATKIAPIVLKVILDIPSDASDQISVSRLFPRPKIDARTRGSPRRSRWLPDGLRERRDRALLTRTRRHSWPLFTVTRFTSVLQSAKLNNPNKQTVSAIFGRGN